MVEMIMSINTDTHTGASFSLGNRLARVGWNLVHGTLFRWSPRPLHGWRSFLLRLFGAKVGRGAHVYPGAKIWAPWNVEIGEETGVADGATLYSQGKITLGRRVVISQGAHLCAGTHDYEKRGFPLVTAPITVGDEAWICADAFVGPGVNIGRRAVVGARAVVTRDVAVDSVVAGNPARVIGRR
jgi:putative colanic acid biosynthesis acetyltransferase WcaF